MDEKTLVRKQTVLPDEETREVSDEERSIVHWISTETVDRQGDIVRSKGMDDEDYAKNPVVLWAHRYDQFPVGKSLWRKKSERRGIKGILVKTQFADTSIGKELYELWKGGYLNASSIGFFPTETEKILDEEGKWTGYEIKKWKLWEYSIVPVPANQEALRLSISKGLFSEPKVVGPLTSMLNESRLCELEACGASMKQEIGSFALKTDFEALNSVIGERITKLEEKIQTFLSEIERKKPAETAVRELTDEEIAELSRAVAHGAVSRIKHDVYIKP